MADEPEKILIYPRVIARREESFKVVCSRCGVFTMSDTYCRFSGCCPVCKIKSTTMVAMGCFHYWSMIVSFADDGLHVLEIAGPFDDPVVAVVALSRAHGLVLPVARA